MPKALKYLLIAFAGLIALLLIVAGIVAATFNPNDYKPLIIKLVKEKKQRTLSIPGEIKLTFFPKIGADLGQVSISEHNGQATFASVNHARVSLALMPLFSKRMVVDRIIIDGLQAHIRREKDGTTNFDDLMSKDKEESGEQVSFNIDSVDISNSHITFDDRQADRKLDIADLNLETGKIADGKKSDFEIRAMVTADKPQAKAAVNAKSGFLFELEQKHYVLDGLDASIKGQLVGFTDAEFQLKGNADLKPDAKRFALDGISLSATGKRAAQNIDVKLDIPKLAITDKDVAGGKVSGTFKLVEGPRTVNGEFSLPSFEGSPQSFKIAALNFDAAIKEAQLEAKAKVSGAVSGDIDKLQFTSPQLKLALDGKQGDKAISGTLTTPFHADLKEGAIRLPTVAAAFTLPNPGGGVLKFKTHGQATANLNKQTLSSSWKGALDESNFDLKFGMTKFSPAAYTFDAAIDRIDADRYRSKPSASASAKTPAKALANAPETPIDLSALKTLNADGSMRIGALKAANIKSTNVRFVLRAAKGRLDINDLSAALYGGSAAGSLSASATMPPRFELRQKLTGIAVGNLLRDAMGKDPIDGKGNVQLDVQTRGATVSHMKKALDGTARLELRDGSIRGVNIAKTIRDAKTKLNALRGNEAPQSGTASTEEKTDFSELSGSFRIANGVAHNEDLSMKSPLLRIGGSGDVNLGESRLDYLVKATVVSSLQGQGGPELQALKGLTVPVRLSGPFTAIGWKVDFAGLASGVAKQKIEEKKEEVRGKVKEKIQEELGDKLKGLFGK